MLNIYFYFIYLIIRIKQNDKINNVMKIPSNALFCRIILQL